MWFAPSGRNTLRPRENESCIAQALAILLVALCGLESSNTRCSLLQKKATVVTLRPRARQVALGRLHPMP
jgi:hypothetical protein